MGLNPYGFISTMPYEVVIILHIIYLPQIMCTNLGGLQGRYKESAHNACCEGIPVQRACIETVHHLLGNNFQWDNSLGIEDNPIHLIEFIH